MNSRRFLALTATLLFVLPISAVAANWQWNRHIEREARNSQILLNRDVYTDFDLLSNLEPAELSKLQYSTTRISGEIIADSQVYWRRQILNGQPGFIELVNVQTSQGTYTLATGWIAAYGNVPDPDLVLPYNFLPADSEVRIRLMPPAESDPNDLPPNQTNSVGTRTDQNVYFELVTAPHELSDLPAPTLESGPHLGYVGQWILIGMTAVVTYVMLLRRGYAKETRSA